MIKKKRIKIIGAVCGFLGFIVIAWIFYPIVAYQINAPKLMTFLSPIAQADGVINTDANINDTDAATWFPTKASNLFTNDPVSFYTITIQRLGIVNAKVAIGGEDLSQSLIQYPGTALPGQIGNTTIFGHSVLPAFYNPKNYLTIFSTIPTLNEGDIITVNYDGITYKYSVEQKYIVDPSDVQVLSQDESDSFLTLVTCVPPGLTTYRGVIKARIMPVGEN
ncbi:MAG TPA: sortase [Patescibacteria group bacterium]|nr:sortase [Patescibacteria group bacterium]